MTPSINSFRLYRFCWLLPLALAALCANGGEPVAVGVKSGRILIGEIDTRTNNRQLWLRTEKPGIKLRRPIEWDSILLVMQGGRELSSAEVLAEVESLKTESTSLTVSAGEELPAPSRPSVASGAPVNRPQQWLPDNRLAQFIQAARANNAQVCSISIDAHIANFNRTVEADGLVLHLYPLNGAGQMIPVDGTLDVELIAQVPPGAPLGVPLPQIGRWTVRVTPDQFGPAGAIVKLPFQGVQPEFDLHVGPYGLVHCRLSIPGNGSFETSQSMLRIRPYSAVRDEAQQITGQRFFDVERVDRWGR